MFLLHKLIDSLAKLIDGGFISGSHRIHHTMAHMILQNDLAGIVQSGANRSQLHQHFGTSATVLYHTTDLFQVAGSPGQTIDHCLLIFVNMAVRMGNAVGMLVSVLMLVVVFVGMMVVFVDMLTHGKPSLCDHLGHGDHAHEHNHTHTHEHTHDGVSHSHEHDHAHSHEHGHPHEHDHLHEQGHEHHHDHDHHHHHHHDHDHACSGECGGCGSHCEHTPMEELLALMKYMANHNTAHANELAALAKQLQQAGSTMAYEQVMAAVSDYEKGNLRLQTVLASLEVK